MIVQVGAERLGESVPAMVGLVVPHAPDQCLLLTGSDSLFSIALDTHRVQPIADRRRPSTPRGRGSVRT